MYFITGGIHAGKTAYVTKQFGIRPADMTDGADCAFETALTAVCIKNYQQFVRRLLADGQEPLTFTESLLEKNTDVIIMMNEIGCGIVPLAWEERCWREHTG
ncbi:MAG: bifunctional adenosylcobinamide kinase/adenosylcobinamide-phosphate guanylyltransferase, partial [Oscillospiraceae bacterium]|nr:bifunctional adenosylcobinamide kinase/adenosylcobinamide-phosphate guanylyltransferase [Oscillospiraceae bacterium]